MMAPAPLSPLPGAAQGLAGDGASLEAIRRRASADPRGAVREAAKQFEALFMQELLKTMRASTLASGMLDNSGSELGTQMLDSQLALQMTGLPGGLADAIARQLEQQMGLAATPPAGGSATGPWRRPPPAAAEAALPLSPPAAAAPPLSAPAGGPGHAIEFVRQHRAAAERAQAATGIPAHFMLAQAAHETGWGRHPIRHADGTPTHNLFGIKAGPGWSGPVAEITTTEYVDGVARKVTARFRAYASPAESFADYAALMQRSPRYREVLAQGGTAEGFAMSLQRAGYATDPAYAEKLGRVINTTLRLQRLQG
jgi:flagellar protein FlgJ